MRPKKEIRHFDKGENPWSKMSEEEIEQIKLEKCRYCKYRGVLGGNICCDYILITKKKRGCRPDECDKYLEGKRRKKIVVPGIHSRSKGLKDYVGGNSYKQATTYFGALLEDYMISHKINQRDLAEMIGIPPDRISRWKFGKDIPKETSVKKVCDAIGISEETAREAIGKGYL